MAFDSTAYGPDVAQILALDSAGQRLMPLVAGVCSNAEAASRLRAIKASELFSKAAAPAPALAGLWLYFSCLDESHKIVQDLPSTEASLWHAILHRQEPDPQNSAYWFRQAGSHPVFRDLSAAAGQIAAKYPQTEFRSGGEWDPFAFIEFCERARRQPNSQEERAALEIQRAEWQLLFDHCARSKP